jgi:hypothetical protein
MANNYYQATIWPMLPAALFNDEDLQSLRISCGLTFEKDEDRLYFFAESNFSEEGEDDSESCVNCLAILQEKLGYLDPSAYPRIVIEVAATCSRMRPGEFGGFAHLITREFIRSMTTWQWLHEQNASRRNRSCAGC